MSNNGSLNDLRGQLFDVLLRLKEGNDPDADARDTIDLDRAKAMNEVGKTIIESAKTEVLATNTAIRLAELGYTSESSVIRRLEENNPNGSKE